MKDISVRSIPHGTVYKDVVIIGNGPSGISLSYMLAGNWPYWNAEKIQKHPDEMLRARLNYADNSKSLVEQDLITLADGLEGRSTNPVSLLLDSLEHPCADLGMELPSMLEYRFDPSKQIDHVVIGKGPPGGSWHRMDPNLRTLSLAGWMSLPGLSYGDWEAIQQRKKCLLYEMNCPTYLRKMALVKTSCPKCIKLRIAKQIKPGKHENMFFNNNNECESEALCCKCTKKICSSSYEVPSTNSTTDLDLLDGDRGAVHSPPRRNLSLKRQVSKEVQTRALVSRVAKYYADYVHHMNLDRFFMNDANIMFIAPLAEDCIKSGNFQNARWIVTGIEESTKRTFHFACKNLVLANGVSDLPNRLGLHGELNGLNRSWVKHDLRELETALENLSEVQRQSIKPILVVGAGLSAADAVTICRLSDIDVIHVYRSKSAGLDRSLPENVYPEYHEVHKMMNDPNQKYNCYTPVPEHTISNLSTDTFGCHFVTVKNLKTSETTTYEVSYCAILIGARPNLRFLSSLSKHLMKVQPKDSYQHIDQCQNHMTRRLAWFKSICEKCKHFNICDWNRRLTPIEFRNRVCGYSTSRSYECQRLCNNEDTNVYQIDDSGIGLGIEPTKPIDSKTNQIDVNKYTNEIQGMPKGIFAMGPLVGDNFVRFIHGGALAITCTLHQEND